MKKKDEFLKSAKIQLLVLFILSVASTDYKFESEFIKQFVLENRDSISINSEHMRVYLHVQPHFFFGSLKLTVVPKDGSSFSEKLVPNTRYVFEKTKSLTLNYTETTYTCTVTLYALPNAKDDPNEVYSIHTRSQTSAIINAVNQKYDHPITWLFDFFEDPRAEITSNVDLILYQPKENETIETTQLNASFSGTVNRLFVLKMNKAPIYSLYYDINATFINDLLFADWTDKIGNFSNCDNMYKCGNIPKGQGDLQQMYHFVVNREVKWWIWALLYGLSATILLTFAIILVIPRKPEASMILSSKPLVSQSIST